MTITRDPVGPGQRSVWDFPRPPALERAHLHCRMVLDGKVFAETRSPLLILETSHPPTYYLPIDDVDQNQLSDLGPASTCEFKGTAHSIRVGRLGTVGWYYPRPRPGYEELAGHLAFGARGFDEVTVDGEVVTPQAGDFYGGWITARYVGPFKGGPGTWGW